MLSQKQKISIIINLFALAHALTVILFKYLNYQEDIALTILTIIMVIWITKIFNTPIEVSATIALLCCFAGFYLGTSGANIISNLWDGLLSNYSNVITTFIVTHIIGWSTYLIVRKQRRYR